MTKEGVFWCTIKCRHLKKFNLEGGGEKLTYFSINPHRVESLCQCVQFGVGTRKMYHSFLISYTPSFKKDVPQKKVRYKFCRLHYVRILKLLIVKQASVILILITLNVKSSLKCQDE